MKKKSNNIIVKICVIILSVFIAINAVWLIHHFLVFGKYEKITFDEAIPNAKVSLKNNLTFSVSKAQYLNFAGNLGIVAAEDEKFLIVWPTLLEGNTYGFMMSDETQTYNFVVDEFGNLLNGDEFAESAKAVYAENKDYAQYLLSEFNAWTEAAEKCDYSFFD